MPGDIFKAKRILALVQYIYEFFDRVIDQGGRASENYVDSYIEERKFQESKGEKSTFTG